MDHFETGTIMITVDHKLDTKLLACLLIMAQQLPLPYPTVAKKVIPNMQKNLSPTVINPHRH
jgi:hypothetical protein